MTTLIARHRAAGGILAATLALHVLLSEDVA